MLKQLVVHRELLWADRCVQWLKCNRCSCTSRQW